MRDNQAWVRDLAASGEIQTEALADLRRILRGGLARSLGHRTDVNDAFLDDATQESLIRILTHLSGFQGRSRFTTWAMSIAVRIALTHLRRKHWRDIPLDQAAEDSELEPEQAVDPSISPQQQAEQQSVLSVLAPLIETELTHRQRTAIRAELSGMPVQEIARRLKSNSNATYKLLHDARKRLKRGLERAGYTAADIRSAFS